MLTLNFMKLNMAAKYPLKKGQKVSEPQFAQWQIEVLTNMAAIKITFKKNSDKRPLF